MPHKVTVNSTNTNVTLPNGFTYPAGASVILSDDQFAKLGSTVFTDGTLTDGGAYPPVQGFTVQGVEDALNGITQLGNTTAPVRYTVRREDVQTDVAAALLTGEVTYLPVVLYAGDVVTNIAVVSGATAAGTPTHYFFALYNTAGTLLAQTADQTSTAWAANTTKDLALATAQTITTTGVYFVGISVTATTVPSLPSKVYVGTKLVSGPITGQAPLARITSGAAAGATAPATIAGATGLTGSLNAPYVVLH